MEKVRIQDDLYNYVNGEWIENAEIPSDRPSAGGFSDLDKGVEELLRKEFDEMVSSGNYPNEYFEKAIKIYKKALDTKKRNKDGIKPALKTLKRIENLTNVASLNRHIVDFITDSISLPFVLSVNPDMKDTNHNIVYIQGPSTILPDTSYYKEGMEQQKQMILGLFGNIAQAILKHTKLSEEDQAKYLEDTFKFDGIIATMVKSSEEWSEYTKMYNIQTSRKVFSAVKPINLRKVFVGLGFDVPEKISVADPKFLKEFKTLFNEENFELYKHWAYVQELVNSCGLLSEELRDLGSQFRRALTGVKDMPSVNRFAYSLASQTFSEPVGLYYGEKYFGEEAKKDVVEMVKEIIETYKKRIRNGFLAESTKEKAIKKLSTMEIKMGYPNKIDELYSKFEVDENDSLYEVMAKISRVRVLHSINELNKEVDRSHWEMPGHMVNACYNPFANDITFPAAILQAPFYSIKQSRSENLGGIGAVIGHEISHAFDNNGALFDENGNLDNWWTKEDLKEFKNKTKAMIKEFDGIELPFGKVNSKLIVSENIADNGGVGVTLDIMSGMKEKSYEEFFMNWARIWCMKAKPEFQQLLLNVDVHAPVILRANMQPRNFDEWYQTFKVTSKDKMYIAPSKRVVIW